MGLQAGKQVSSVFLKGKGPVVGRAQARAGDDGDGRDTLVGQVHESSAVQYKTCYRTKPHTQDVGPNS